LRATARAAAAAASGVAGVSSVGHSSRVTGIGGWPRVDAGRAFATAASEERG
jgi:hypothetical protein